SKEADGCYYLGMELSSYPENHADVRKAIGYLKAVMDSDRDEHKGSAALCLADLLRSVGGSVTETYHYYQEAEKFGFPDILVPSHAQESEASAATG
ncbi:MAG: hypothetical protein IIU49_02430, partial [Spirochaetales bacterium]|nr:hypothetical protein [Spirochaetales bacterium]